MGSERRKARWSQTVEPEGASPVWGEDRVPRCTEDCPSHDGKRCKLIGLRAPTICEPTVAEMARALYETEPSTPPATPGDARTLADVGDLEELLGKLQGAVGDCTCVPCTALRRLGPPVASGTAVGAGTAEPPVVQASEETRAWIAEMTARWPAARAPSLEVAPPPGPPYSCLHEVDCTDEGSRPCPDWPAPAISAPRGESR